MRMFGKSLCQDFPSAIATRKFVLEILVETFHLAATTRIIRGSANVPYPTSFEECLELCAYKLLAVIRSNFLRKNERVTISRFGSSDISLTAEHLCRSRVLCHQEWWLADRKCPSHKQPYVIFAHITAIGLVDTSAVFLLLEMRWIWKLYYTILYVGFAAAKLCLHEDRTCGKEVYCPSRAWTVYQINSYASVRLSMHIPELHAQFANTSFPLESTIDLYKLWACARLVADLVAK